MTSYWLRLSTRERRTVLAGALLVVTAFAVRAMPRVLSGLERQRARAELSAAERQQAELLLKVEDELEDSLTARARRLIALAPHLIAGATVAEAQAEFAALVSNSATRHRLRLTRSDARPDSLRLPFTRLRLQVEAEGDVSGLSAWLGELEGERPLVSVEQLSISAVEPTAAVSQPEALRLSVTIAAVAAPRSQQ